MKIILSESGFETLGKLMFTEALGDIKMGYGRSEINYSELLRSLDKVPNLHTDRYKDYALLEAYDAWGKVNFDKSTKEYAVWASHLKRFMDYLNGHLHYVNDKKNDNIGTFTFYRVVLDPKWVKSVVVNNKDEWECIYTTILKIYKNKPIWNDLFFNPIFEEMKTTFDLIKKSVMKDFLTYKKILPIKEYAEISTFIRNGEANPSLFYEPNGTEKTKHDIESVKNNKPELSIDDDWG